MKVALYTTILNLSKILLKKIIINDEKELIGVIDICVNVSILCSKIAESMNLKISEDAIEVCIVDNVPGTIKSILTPIKLCIKGKMYDGCEIYAAEFNDEWEFQMILRRDILSQIDSYISLKENALLTEEKTIENINRDKIMKSELMLEEAERI